MIRIPSLYSLWENVRRVVGRFPVPFLLSIWAVGVWLIAIDAPNDLEYHYYKILILSNITFCLTLSVDLYKERMALKPWWSWSFKIAGLLVCVFLFFVLEPAWRETDVYRLLLLVLAAHLLVSFAPFAGGKHMHGFWQYNKFLFLRILTAALYSGVLYVGLAIALLCIEQLFDWKIQGHIYYRMFAIIAAGFNTTFFLAGFPVGIQSFEGETNYPKGLKVFTQYVLIPLLVIYLAILLVYETKIVWQQQLPNGTVSILILGYAVLGILSYLLLYPIRIQKGNEWMKTFSKFFFILMVPLLVLLFVAVWVRVAHYAITEPRYFLIILAIWLSAVTIYFLVTKVPSIQVMPMSLCLLALLASFGPQGAASIARHSQLARYIKLQQSKSDTTQYEQAAIIRYMVNNHGLASLQGLTDKNLTTIQNAIKIKKDSGAYSLYQRKKALTDTAFALLKIKPTFKSDYTHYLNIMLQGGTISINGYEYMIDLNAYSDIEADSTAQLPIGVKHAADRQRIAVEINGTKVLNFNFNAFCDTLRKKVKEKGYTDLTQSQTVLMPEKDLRWTKYARDHEITIVFKSLYLPMNNADKKFSNVNYTAVLLLREIKTGNVK